MKQFLSHNSYLYKVCFTLFIILFTVNVWGVRAEDNKEDINVHEIVMEHMADSYEWHIITIGDKNLTIPLPIIVYSKNGGWSLFSSARLHNDTGIYRGFKIAPKESPYAGKLVELSDGEWSRPLLDLSLTKVAFALIINSVIFVTLILGVASWYRKREVTSKSPGGFVGFMEMFIVMIYEEVIKDSVGPEYRRFTGFLLTLFFFIFVNNLMGLIPIFPGGVGVTGNIAVTFVLALSSFIAINFWATKHYWKDIFWPDVPTLLKVPPTPIIPLIEIMELITKPFALMVRLFANLMAGHMGIIIFVSLIFIAGKMGVAAQGGLTVVSVLFTIFMNLLELLVSFIQAYVFTLLTAVFIGLAQEGRKKRVSKNQK